MICSASISRCGRYRFTLRREWDKARYSLPVCMLNPSTADAERDDPTIRALIEFAKAWGYGGLLVVNLFAWRASHPSQLAQAMAEGIDIVPMGANDPALRLAMICALAGGSPLLAAWGNNAPPHAVAPFVELAAAFGVPLVCLGVTQTGAPIHPAARGRQRVPRDRQPQPWSQAA